MTATILIVEDDDDFREMLGVYLRYSGFSVVTAANGLEGLHRMREARPCLILLDLMMPVMDGRAFRAAQLADPQFASVPVICVSAMFDAERVAGSLGVVEFIRKPVEWEALTQAIRRHTAVA